MLLKWLVAALVFGVGIWLCCGASSQGDGAREQMRGAKRSFAKAKALSALPMPLSFLAIQPATNVYWFAATTTDSEGTTSDYSDEISWLNTVRSRLITLAWDAPVWTNALTNYSVFIGRSSMKYETNFNAGTNLQLTVELWPHLTNIVVAVAYYDGRTLSLTNPAKSIELFTNASISSWRF